MKNRSVVIDLLRIVSIIGVVGNHLMYPVSSRSDFFGGTSWWLAFMIYTLSLVAVPSFIMISGYLLIDRIDSIEKNFHRTISKLVVPLIFWFGFYLGWKNKFRSVSFSITEIVNFILSGNMFIFYFLVILSGLYLLLPILQLVARHGSKKLHYIILFGSFMVTWIMGFTHYFANLSGSVTSLATWWLPFFSYFWWGFMVKKKYFQSDIKFLLLFISWVIFTIVIGLLGYNLNAANITLAFKNGIFYWHDYLSPTVSIMAVGFFTWLITNQKIKKNTFKPRISGFINNLANLSYGVFLIHMFVIDYLDIKYGFAIEFIGDNLISFVTIRPVLTILISFIIIWLISKTPYLRRLVGIV